MTTGVRYVHIRVELEKRVIIRSQYHCLQDTVEVAFQVKFVRYIPRDIVDHRVAPVSFCTRPACRRAVIHQENCEAFGLKLLFQDLG